MSSDFRHRVRDLLELPATGKWRLARYVMRAGDIMEDRKALSLSVLGRSVRGGFD